MRLRCFVVLLIAAGCATGGMKSPGTGGDDAPPPMQDGPAATHDAAGGDATTTVDTPPPPPPPPPDAAPAVDAAMPDAPSQFFCTQNSQCTNAGECCITLGGPTGVCGKGMVILGQCVPG